MSYSSSVTTVLQKCTESTHFKFIATWKLSWDSCLPSAAPWPNELYQWSNAMHYSLASRHNFASFRLCNFYWDKRWQNNKRVYKDFFVNVVNVYYVYGTHDLVIASPTSWLLHYQATKAQTHRRLDEPAAVCTECGCAFGVGRSTLRPHNAGARRAALTSGSTSGGLQDGHHPGPLAAYIFT